MIIDLPSTTTSRVNKKLVELRESGGAVALGRVLTLVIVTGDGSEVEKSIQAANAASRDPNARYSTIADQLVEMGRLGQKSGSGYYLYEAGNRNPIPDPEIEALVKRTAADAGIAQREISPDEIVNTLMAAMVNEGAKILGEGVAARAPAW